MPKTKTNWTTEDISKALDGKWLSGNAEQLIATGVRYSYSQINPGDMYIMPSPEKWGVRYNDIDSKVNRIISEKPSAIITQKHLLNVPETIPVFKVEDTFEALWKLGIYASKRFMGKEICITGSVGKSTTKECLYHVLSKQGKAFRSEGNFNHQLGFPLSLAQTPMEYDYGIYEVAIWVLKAYSEQVKAAQPQVAIITDIQPDHLMYAKTIENVADIKARLFSALGQNGIAIINGENDFCERLKNHAIQAGVKNIIIYGNHPESTAKVLHQVLTAHYSHVKAEISGINIEYTLNVAGAHVIKNTLAVLAAVHALGADVVKAAKDLENFMPIEKHTFLEKVPFKQNHIHLIDDTYSANPASVRAGSEYANIVAKEYNSRLIAVLGDIQELGEDSAQLHAGLAEVLIKNNVSKVFLIGKEMENLWKNLPSSMHGTHTLDAAKLCAHLFTELKENDTVLVKTSRRTTELLPIIEALKAPQEYLKNHKKTLEAGAHPDETFKVVPVSCENSKKFNLILVGDTSPGENYQERLEASGGNNILKTQGYDYSLNRMKKLLLGADIVVANLETPLTSLKQSPFTNQKDYIHWSDIKQTPICLLKHNVNFVNLANNHACDYGKEGLVETFSTLKDFKINYFGGGKDIREAQAPLVLKVKLSDKEIHIALIGAFEESKRYREKFDTYAENDKPGIASLNSETIKKTIQQLKQHYDHLYVIVFPHWGDNYQWKSELQNSYAKALVDAGADLIVGHGSHMLQEIERISDRWVFYSIGNFVFNSPGRYKQLKAPPYSFVVNLAFEFNNNNIWVSPHLYPIVTDNRQTNYQTRPVDQHEFNEVCTLLAGRNTDVSSMINSYKMKRDQVGYYIELPSEIIASKN